MTNHCKLNSIINAMAYSYKAQQTDIELSTNLKINTKRKYVSNNE